MKNLIYIFSLLYLFQNFSCQESKNSKVVTPNQNVHEKKITKSLFVKAENGLNYRDAPKGKIINKFLYNEKLDIIENTGIHEEIYDDGKLIQGEWISVLNDKDTVYVFDAYLTHWKDVSDIINENDSYIDIKALYNGTVKEFKNDTIIIKEINLKDFASVKKIQKEDFEIAYDQNLKSKRVDSILKHNNTLIINCENHKTNKIEDKNIDNDELSEIYKYYTTFDEIKSHLIIMMGWEWESYYLVNYETCHTIKLNGFPIFNSDYSKMICRDNDLGDQSIFINAFDGENIQVKYTLVMPIAPNRCVFYNKTLFLESLSEWNDGKQHKVSRQYFKFIFK